jgi:hypothetical protein
MFEHPRRTRPVLIVFGVAVTAAVVTAHLPDAGRDSNSATHRSLNAR